MAIRMGIVSVIPETIRKRNYLLGLAKSPSTEVGIQRISSTQYQIFQKLAAPNYWVMDLIAKATTGLISIAAHSIGKLRFAIDQTQGFGTVTGVDQEHSSVFRSGGAWSSGSNAGAYGGTYRQTNNTTLYAEYTIPAPTTAVGLYAVRAPNGGVSRATINGSTSLCNLLPTAQELVNSGALPATALTDVGGPLAPSDKCVLFYASPSNFLVDIPIAAGLPSASYVVRLQNVNVTPTVATDKRIYDSGYYYKTGSETTSYIHIGAWTTNSQPLAYGGSYAQSTTVGDKISIGYVGTDFGLRIVKAPNGGIAKVLVDGSSTAANELPTAQSLVDAGSMAATYLTTSGGPLAPTDRVIDYYRANSNYDASVEVVSGLSQGSHVIEIVCTTARNISSSSNRTYSSGMSYATSTISFSSPGASIVSTRSLLSSISVLEYAYDIAPPAQTHEFVGNDHGSDYPISWSVTVDGIDPTLIDGEVAVGLEVIINRSSELRFPTTGATKYADVDLTYTLNENGFRVDHNTSWVSAVTTFNIQTAMFPLDESIFSKGSIVGVDVDYTMSPVNPGSVNHGLISSDFAYMWAPNSNDEFLATILALNYPEMFEYFSMGGDVRIQDRDGDNFIKVYMLRSSGGNALSAGTVWESSALYRIGIVDNVDSLVSN